MSQKRKSYSSSFKKKVTVEALSGLKTLQEIAAQYEVHPLQVSKWKKKLLDNAEGIFNGTIKSPEKRGEEKVDELYKQVGKLQVENDWLKKKVGLE